MHIICKIAGPSAVASQSSALNCFSRNWLCSCFPVLVCILHRLIVWPFCVQSSVCLKLLAFDLLELLILSLFPEMDYTFRQLREQKYKFGEFGPTWWWYIFFLITGWAIIIFYHFLHFFISYLRYIVLCKRWWNSILGIDGAKLWVQFVN